MHPTQFVGTLLYRKKNFLYILTCFVETCNSINKTLALLSQTHKREKKKNFLQNCCNSTNCIYF